MRARLRCPRGTRPRSESPARSTNPLQPAGWFQRTKYIRMENVLSTFSSQEEIRMPLSRVVGALSILTALAFTAFFTALSAAFDYPAILRQPPSAVLTRFAAGGPGLLALWYGMALAAASFVPVVVLMRRLLADADSAWLSLAAVAGTLAGLVQTL